MDKDTVNKIAEHYRSSGDFDSINTKLASRIICPYCENSNDQMSKLQLPWPIIDSLFEIGKDHPDLASHLFVRARRRST